MNLTPTQRRQLLDGACTSLLFPYEDGQPVHGACCLVLQWDEQRRIADSFGNVTVVPARPVHWIEVTSVKRHRKGDWQVRFDAVDQREHPEFLARGGGYTTSRFRAIDELETVPRKDLERMAKTAYERDRVMRMERVAAARTQRNRFRKERLRAASVLRSAA